jgi:N-acetylneuraminic acid mutarotase
MSASTVNGKIYVFGGFTHVRGPGLPTVEEYDPETDTWTAKADIPTPRLGPASCVVDGIIYVIGGASQVSQQLKTVEAYNPETDTWTIKADMPAARMMLSACAVNGKIYAIGGRYGSLEMYTWIEEYDPVTDIWTEKFEMPIEKGGYAACVMNDKIYIIGGANIESGVWTIYPIIEEYDPILNTLTRREDMPTQRFGLGARAIDGKIYVIGGAATDIRSGHPGVNTVEEYDPRQ